MNTPFNDEEKNFIKEFPIAISTVYDMKKDIHHYIFDNPEREKSKLKINEIISKIIQGYKLEETSQQELISFFEKQIQMKLENNPELKEEKEK